MSPGTPLWGIDEGIEGPDLYRYLVSELNTLSLAYLHIMHLGNDPLLADIRKRWQGTLILNRPHRSRHQIGSDVASGLAELEAYGTMILSTPDFVARLKSDAPMNEVDPNTFYGGGAEGYTDYPVLSMS